MRVVLIVVTQLTARQLLLNLGYRYHNGVLVDQNLRPVHFEFLIHQSEMQKDNLTLYSKFETIGNYGHYP